MPNYWGLKLSQISSCQLGHRADEAAVVSASEFSSPPSSCPEGARARCNSFPELSVFETALRGTWQPEGSRCESRPLARSISDFSSTGKEGDVRRS
mmetsp:Transcript_73993/g.119385  ORF Transcript_73993/g.119385 Transcript_73993/m.119385 type:complete len:96 (-) Transcript_73993:161-448(-)